MAGVPWRVATLASYERSLACRYSSFPLCNLYFRSHGSLNFQSRNTSNSHTQIRTRSGTKRKIKMLQVCTFKSVLDKGDRASMGVWQTLPGQNVSRVLARTPGVDWVLVDCEHGNIDDAAMHEAVPAIASCGASPIVRLPDMQGWMIKSEHCQVLSKLNKRPKYLDTSLMNAIGALDAGAHGVSEAGKALNMTGLNGS